ncbi:MAG TPA: hypothetical protein VIX17_14185 [Pyrinomonadaceae bacterium]
MINLASIDDQLEKAFDLACFIQRDRNAAVRIVTRALAELEVAVTTQGKRLYYKPAGRPQLRRSQPDRLRNKISFCDTHLLQRLIYIESEPYEIAQERSDGSTMASEEDFVIHFVKHLVGKTIKRNSFYVTLGLGRLLHSYTTAETMDIYNAVIQNPESVKDDYYYRSRKGVLMQELKQRFGDLINVCHGPRGEERFEADENPGRFVELVRDCLNFFTPWNTPCLVPAGIDPIREGIPSLSYHGKSEEDTIEVNRIHALLHPDCFGRLMCDLHLDPPEKRLHIPRFFYANDVNGNSSDGRRHQPKLTEEEISSIKRELDGNAKHRKAVHGGFLRIIVDGNERASFDLSEKSSTRLNVQRDSELIEVRSRNTAGEEVLLASHLLARAGTDDRVEHGDVSITLEGGQRISIVVSSATDETDATVEISYRETNPFRAASFLFQQTAQSIRRSPFRSLWSYRSILAATLSVLLLGIGLVAFIKYRRKDNVPVADRNQVATSGPTGGIRKKENSETAPAAPDSNKPSTAGDTSRQPRAVVQPSSKIESTARNSAQKAPATKTPSETASETGIETRSTKGRLAVVPLSAIKKVSVETLGGKLPRQSLRKMLEEKLRASNQIALAEDRNEADALIEVSVVKGSGSETAVTVQLINGRGKVIWPNGNHSGKYHGSLDDISAQIIKDLLTAIREARQ